jgi:hypothetical protein
MRTIINFTNDRSIPPMSEREWNYSFAAGERVKLIPEMVKNHINDPYDPFQFINIDLSYLDKIGVITDCYPDLHCNLGTSYMCLVDFEGEIISLLSMYFYTSLKFYK